MVVANFLGIERADPAERMSALTNAITRAKTAPLRCELLAMLPGVTIRRGGLSPRRPHRLGARCRADAERKGTPLDASSMSDFCARCWPTPVALAIDRSPRLPQRPWRD